MSNEQIQAAIYIGWAIVGAGYPAACIWIVVRLFSRPKRWVKWTLAALLSLPVLYVASYGPLAWASQHSIGHDLPWPIQSALMIYSLPLAWTINSDDSPRWLHDGIIWYLGLWS
jgi:hypothetical protein